MRRPPGRVVLDGTGHHGARRRRARASARPAHRVRLPVLSSAAVADRARERAGPDGDCRRPRRSRGAPTRCSTKSGSPTAAITIRRSSRAASSSASRSRARWRTIRRSCSPTSRPATSTARRATTSSTCCSTSIARGTTLVLVTHDPELAAVADVAIALRDGRVTRVTERQGGEQAAAVMSVRPANGGARAPRVLAPAAVLLHLRRRSASARSSRCARSIQSVRAGLMREARDDHRLGRRGPDQSRVDAGDPAPIWNSGSPIRRSSQRTESIETATMVRPEAGAAVARMVELRGGRGGLSVLRHARPRRTARRTRTICFEESGRSGPAGAARPSSASTVGDRILIGGRPFTIRGVIEQEPGRRVGGFSLGSRVLVDYADLRRPGCWRSGAARSYQILLQVPTAAVEPLTRDVRESLRDRFVNARSYRVDRGPDRREPRAGRELPEPRRLRHRRRSAASACGA